MIDQAHGRATRTAGREVVRTESLPVLRSAAADAAFPQQKNLSELAAEDDLACRDECGKIAIRRAIAELDPTLAARRNHAHTFLDRKGQRFFAQHVHASPRTFCCAATR